jgi:hypothetical protein
MFHSVIVLSTIISNTEKGTHTRSRNNFPDVLHWQKSGSNNIFPNGESQTLTIFLAFHGTYPFFLPNLDCKSCYFFYQIFSQPLHREGGDQTFKPRPRGPQQQPHGPPPNQPYQPTLNRLTSHPRLSLGWSLGGVTRQWLNVKSICQNALDVLTNSAQHLANFFILPKRNGCFIRPKQKNSNLH